jgi:hypothetical protein
MKSPSTDGCLSAMFSDDIDYKKNDTTNKTSIDIVYEYELGAETANPNYD